MLYKEEEGVSDDYILGAPTGPDKQIGRRSHGSIRQRAVVFCPSLIYDDGACLFVARKLFVRPPVSPRLDGV